MRDVIKRLFHHVMLLAALLSLATLLGFITGASFFLGGTPWEKALAFSEYLCVVLSFPAAMIWANHMIQDLRTVFSGRSRS